MNENMTVQELHEYRRKLYHDALRWEKPERVPFNGFIWGWAYLDAGYTSVEASRDYEKCKDSMVKIGRAHV